ncbi:hypothetical protein M378DRAFT_13183 [Amanita muscaria Koide BX008]|uniref:Amidase domain-containing protein n=1 Tax=Amanita muscaria (strain Koide BX008) TaxID=946122 RepID=A0A0C2SFX8_AMAMK|nr:hypothetical protein M378DRAFT_13183 [Amanita muscaria Koide BX008]
MINATSDSKNSCGAKLPDLFTATIEDLQFGLSHGHFTSVDLVKAYLARIDEVNHQGPALHAVIETNPSALSAAQTADELRKTGQSKTLLHGIPIMLKDNVATRFEDGMNTTAGSYALLDSVVPGDATIAKKLRDAGAIIMGKASLSEWANYRGSYSANGWSGRGGQATSAFYPQGDAGGSSTGSGISTSIGLVTAAIGTETDGSIISPANRNNLVGIKPTVGLTSRYLVIPISQNQDTAGPMAKTVADAATILSAIAGPDPRDNFTLAQPLPVPDYTKHLLKNALKGARIGVHYSVNPNQTDGNYPEYILQTFIHAIETVFRPLGAEIVDNINLDDITEILASKNETIVLSYDFKYGINKYLSELVKIPTGATTIEGLIKFNADNPQLELPLGRDNQTKFLAAANTTDLEDPVYIAALNADHDLGRTRGIDATLQKYNLDAIVTPAPGYTSVPSAIAGYPIVTVPLGFLPANTSVTPRPYGLPLYPAPNMPFGIAFVGTQWSEARLIELAYSYEQATNIRLEGKPFALPTTQLKDIVCETD